MTGSAAASADTPLASLLREKLAAGPLPFREYMEICLYHPQFGYYMAERQRFGRGGDFFTASSVHALFGRLISRQLREMWDVLGRPQPFTVAEMGAGEGHLALDILDALQAEAPDCYRSLRYAIVEISPDNRARQAAQLAAHPSRVVWLSASELAGMVGCILSNELVDAFPVHLVEMTQSGLQEVFVAVQAGHFAETLQPPSTPELQNYLDRAGIKLLPGNRAEINLAAPQWMKTCASLLERGFVLTIDYGYPAQELYAPWRKSGTLMCYHRHSSNEDPFAHPGEQDMTAHIDFSALMRSGEDAGLTTLFFGEQCKFLLALGFVELLMAEEAKETDPNRARALRLTLKHLILPEGGMGDVFKVLVQGKNTGSPQLLCSRPLCDLPFM